MLEAKPHYGVFFFWYTYEWYYIYGDQLQQEEKMRNVPFQPNLPLDERFRQAEQYALDLEVSKPQPHLPDVVANGACPHHRIFVYGCPYCDPK